MPTRVFCAGCVAVSSLLLAPLALAKADEPRDFISKVIQGDNSELQLGRLAANKGRRQDVRDYGNMLAEDHAKAREQAVRIAHDLGVEPPREPMDKAEREYDKLQGLSGRDFDEEFLRYMIDDHREDIHDFREQTSGDNRDVSRMARQQLPTLEKHLKTAERLQSGKRARGRG